MSRILKVTELNALELSPGAVCVIGGTFDPFHSGHLSIIRLLSPLFTRLIIAPTEQNPWKVAPVATLQQRLEMIELILNAEKIPLLPLNDRLTEGVSVLREPYTYVDDCLTRLRAELEVAIFWAVGADSADSVPNWRSWNSMNLTVIAVPISIPVHATSIREGSVTVHRAIDGYVRKHGLYGHPLSS